MTLEDLSDIEDIGGSHGDNVSTEKSIPTFRSSSTSTVRIRKLRKPLKQQDCENGESCGSCSCSVTSELHEGIQNLFDENQAAGDYVNRVLPTDEPETVERPNVVTNDINPGCYVIYVKTWGCSHNNSDSEYMAGLLAAHGFNVTTTDHDSSHVVILNSCTVKGPSEQHFKNEINRAVANKKHVILAGCVPQSDKSYRRVASVIGVQQIDRIVEVVEETLRGNKLTFVSARRNGMKSAGADLSLPKIRKNELIEIVPISSGCLNNCTYCKTKQARGQLVSYPIDVITDRIKHVCEQDGVKEIWFTSEDLGCWGIDLGLTIVDLLDAVVECLPESVMLRLGMTNPPYILDHLEDISRILSHRNVYEFLHIPVQSGSTPVLAEMKREYTRADFERICDFMLERHPNITIATDVICGYPTETEEDFEETFSLVDKYKFPVLFINQFYPRPGTHAAKLKRINTEVVKGRTRRLNELFQGYQRIDEGVVGGVQRVLVTEIAHDRIKYVGHNKQYEQVLIDKSRVQGSQEIMGKWMDVEIESTCKFAMIGGNAYHVVSTPTYPTNYNLYISIICVMLLCVLIKLL